MWFSKGTSILIERNPCAATNKQGQRTETLHLYQERPKPVLSDWSTNVSFVLSLFKKMFSWPRLALRVEDGSRKYLFTFSKSFLFSSTVYSKRCFPDQDWLLGVRTGQENMFLPSASPSLFSFRPPSIQGDVFYPRNGKSTTVNNCQWSRHRLQTEHTRLKLSFEWPILHHGGKYLSQKMSISRLWDCLI